MQLRERYGKLAVEISKNYKGKFNSPEETKYIYIYRNWGDDNV